MTKAHFDIITLKKVIEMKKIPWFKWLQEIKNRKLFFIDNVELSFEDEALREVAVLAIKRKTGARGLRAILEEAMVDIMFNLPEYKGYGIIITKDVILNKSEPILIKHKGE